jgi:hypothetical protein
MKGFCPVLHTVIKRANRLWGIVYGVVMHCRALGSSWRLCSVSGMREIPSYMVQSAAAPYSGKGRRLVCASNVSLGEVRMNPVMCSATMRCTHASVFTNPLVPFVFLLMGMRNKSAAYKTFEIATAV